jgi:hypothetical protein
MLDEVLEKLDLNLSEDQKQFIVDSLESIKKCDILIRRVSRRTGSLLQMVILACVCLLYIPDVKIAFYDTHSRKQQLTIEFIENYLKVLYPKYIKEREEEIKIISCKSIESIKFLLPREFLPDDSNLILLHEVAVLPSDFPLYKNIPFIGITTINGSF